MGNIEVGGKRDKGGDVRDTPLVFIGLYKIMGKYIVGMSSVVLLVFIGE